MDKVGARRVFVDLEGAVVKRLIVSYFFVAHGPRSSTECLVKLGYGGTSPSAALARRMLRELACEHVLEPVPIDTGEEVFELAEAMRAIMREGGL